MQTKALLSSAGICTFALRPDIEPSIPRRPLLWLNLVCLDAPLVAVAWQWLFGRAFAIEIGNEARAALFLTAWLIYLVDRFVDSLAFDVASVNSLRQMFCARHRGAWSTGLLVGAAADACLIWRRLDGEIVRAGLVVGLLALTYLTLNWIGRLWRMVPIKEIAIGSVFALGATLVPLVRIGTMNVDFLLALFPFAAVCSLNCISIAVWERRLDTAQGKWSIATHYPLTGKRIRFLAIVIAAFSCALVGWATEAASVFGCVAVSSLLLGGLHSERARLRRDERVAVADLVLLTPVFPLLWTVV
ncbi:MAG TPA: hypothetical protein VGQ82_09800, partial [Chthoniobacterales bacterium]|nr:hypothetical protein [Chthoniobacterales bacterium]